MKSLTSTLLQAQQSASLVPYVKAVFSDRLGDRRRLHWTRHYQGSEDDRHHAVSLAADGSLVRAYIDATPSLQVQRVTNPGPASDFSSWTQLDTDISHRGVALTLDPSTGDAWLFYVDADGVSIKARTSDDDGASWSTASIVVTASAAVSAGLSAAAADDGDILLLWAENGTVYRSRYDGSSWGARTAWTHTVDGVTGLACTYLLDWQVVVTGTEATTQHARAWALRYGDGVNQAIDTWGSLRDVTGATAGSGVSYAAPTVAWQDAWRLFLVEVAADTRVYWSSMDLLDDFNEEHWQEPVAFDSGGSQYGVTLAARDGAYWLSRPDGVWSAAWSEDLDASDDVLEASVMVTGDGGRVELVLDNSHGAYTASANGESTPPTALQRGARLRLTPGYLTTAGAEVPQPSAYWVESLRLTGGPRPLLNVTARDGWSLLATWRARRQFVWAAGESTISQILGFLLTRAGLRFASVSTSDAFTTLQPAFAVNPGESGVTAVRRLLAKVEDVALWRGGQLTSLHTEEDDAPTYELGDAHSLTSLELSDAGPGLNRVRVEGLDSYGEAFDFADVEASGERSDVVLDLNLTTDTQAADRANAVLRKSHLGARADRATLFGVHCGAEVYDVVSVTDAQARLDEAPRRVLAYAWRFDSRRGRYDMELTLGNV